jgi:hypothetical protein
VPLQKKNFLSNNFAYACFVILFILVGLTTLASSINLLVLRLASLNAEEQVQERLEQAEAKRQQVRLEGDVISRPKFNQSTSNNAQMNSNNNNNNNDNQNNSDGISVCSCACMDNRALLNCRPRNNKANLKSNSSSLRLSGSLNHRSLKADGSEKPTGGLKNKPLDKTYSSNNSNNYSNKKSLFSLNRFNFVIKSNLNNKKSSSIGGVMNAHQLIQLNDNVDDSCYIIKEKNEMSTQKV